MKKLLALIFVGLLTACSTLPSGTQMSTNRDMVRLVIAPGLGNGSGVVVAPGVILTARHVADVLDSGAIELFVEPEHVKVTLIRKSKDHDLALLSAPGVGCPCAVLAEELPDLNDETVTVGFPSYEGIHVQILTTGRFMGVDGDKIVTTAPASPGNSGGGVFSARGLIGILVEGLAPIWHLNRSISLETIKEFLNE